MLSSFYIYYSTPLMKQSRVLLNNYNKISFYAVAYNAQHIQQHYICQFNHNHNYKLCIYITIIIVCAMLNSYRVCYCIHRSPSDVLSGTYVWLSIGNNKCICINSYVHINLYHRVRSKCTLIKLCC